MVSHFSDKRSSVTDESIREDEVKGMAERIIGMRGALYNKLTNDLKTPGEWGHIKSQIGMFRSVSRRSVSQNPS